VISRTSSILAVHCDAAYRGVPPAVPVFDASGASKIIALIARHRGARGGCVTTLGRRGADEYAQKNRVSPDA
jgi:hypothetical protein